MSANSEIFAWRRPFDWREDHGSEMVFFEGRLRFDDFEEDDDGKGE